MVTQAIGTALRVAGTITSVVQALKEIEAARKQCNELEKRGLVAQARALGKELDRQERKLRASLIKAQRSRERARRKARQQTRGNAGRFI